MKTSTLIGLFLAVFLLSSVCAEEEDEQAGTAADEEEPDVQDYWIFHGYLMAIAWGVLVPIAVGMSILRHFLPKVGLSLHLWFQLHRAINLTAMILTVAGFAVAVKAFQKTGDTHFFKGHPRRGLVVFVMVLVQVGLAFIRPHAPQQSAVPPPAKNSLKEGATTDDEEPNGDAAHEIGDEDEEAPESKKTLLRHLWEYKHRAMGVVLVGLAWSNCHSGLEIYAEDYGTDRINVFWGVTGGIACFIVFVGYILRLDCWIHEG